MRKTLKKDLDEHFSTEDFIDYCYNKIFDWKEYLHECIADLEKHIPKTFIVENTSYKPSSFTFVNFVSFLYHFDLLNEVIEYPRFDAYPEYWKFYLKPNAYNYSYFDPEWLNISGWKHIHNKLAAIPK
jgi:hypothetical protein